MSGSPPLIHILETKNIMPEVLNKYLSLADKMVLKQTCKATNEAFSKHCKANSYKMKRGSNVDFIVDNHKTRCGLCFWGTDWNSENKLAFYMFMIDTAQILEENTMHNKVIEVWCDESEYENDGEYKVLENHGFKIHHQVSRYYITLMLLGAYDELEMLKVLGGNDIPLYERVSKCVIGNLKMATSENAIPTFTNFTSSIFTNPVSQHHNGGHLNDKRCGLKRKMMKIRVSAMYKT